LASVLAKKQHFLINLKKNTLFDVLSNVLSKSQYVICSFIQVQSRFFGVTECCRYVHTLSMHIFSRKFQQLLTKQQKCRKRSEFFFLVGDFPFLCISSLC
jgi:hypothetical protein